MNRNIRVFDVDEQEKTAMRYPSSFNSLAVPHQLDKKEKARGTGQEELSQAKSAEFQHDL